jgi:hypothetical protein
VDLVHDLLDKQAKDKHHHAIGRIDGIVLEVAQGRAPRVAWVEIGLQTLASRLSETLGRWAAAFERRWGPVGAGPVRLPLTKIRDVGLDVEFDVVGEQTGTLRWERYLKRRIVERLPGSER